MYQWSLNVQIQVYKMIIMNIEPVGDLAVSFAVATSAVAAVVLLSWKILSLKPCHLSRWLGLGHRVRSFCASELLHHGHRWCSCSRRWERACFVPPSNSLEIFRIHNRQHARPIWTFSFVRVLVTQHTVNMSANTDRIFMAEQIKVPTDLPEILKEYTKAVIRQGCETNEQVIAFSAQYFQAKVAESNAPATKEE